MNQNARADVWILFTLLILSVSYSAIFLKEREHTTLKLRDNTRT